MLHGGGISQWLAFQWIPYSKSKKRQFKLTPGSLQVQWDVVGMSHLCNIVVEEGLHKKYLNLFWWGEPANVIYSKQLRRGMKGVGWVSNLPRVELQRCQIWRRQRSRGGARCRAWAGCPTAASPRSSCLFGRRTWTFWCLESASKWTHLEYGWSLSEVWARERFWSLRGSTSPHQGSTQERWGGRGQG